jgi:hypothetical protein
MPQGLTNHRPPSQSITQNRTPGLLFLAGVNALIDTIRRRCLGALVALRGWRLGFNILAAVIAMPTTGAEANDGNAGASCCNVLELRQYTLHPGRQEPFVDLFDRVFADPLDATGMTVVGQFRDLDRPPTDTDAALAPARRTAIRLTGAL